MNAEDANVAERRKNAAGYFLKLVLVLPLTTIPPGTCVCEGSRGFGPAAKETRRSNRSGGLSQFRKTCYGFLE